MMRAYRCDYPEIRLTPNDLRSEGLWYSRHDASDGREELEHIRCWRGYTHEELVLLGNGDSHGGDPDDLTREHRHAADEARFMVEGNGILEVRDWSDRWIRIELQSGDFVVVPAGRHHRFFIGENGFCRFLRLYFDDDDRVPIYRESGEKQQHA
ncbi:MAG: cupin domain-containing protein [Thermoanaerobaculia bacterium]